MNFDAVVIGGGPAGIMAAARSAERGKKALLIEGNDILGRKILISGKGRCNVTNSGDIDEYLENFGKTGLFLRTAFSAFFNTELTEFFEKRGVELTVERGKRVFPKSGRSKAILTALRRYLDTSGARVLLKSRVKDVMVEKSGRKKVLLADGTAYLAGSVAICTGGLSYSRIGATGFGFEIAKKLGHTVARPSPALVPIVTESRLPKAWQGVSLKNVKASVIGNGKKRAERFGDALFTHFGLSGPIMLDLSAVAHDLIGSGEDVSISINLKPAVDRAALDDRLVREFAGQPNKTANNILKALLPIKMTEGFLDICDIDRRKKANQITKRERNRLVSRMTDLGFKVKGVRPIDEAIVTRGGVDTKEIDPRTMESKLVKGLFFAGEVIDVDARTGGYNMQAAFSTGFVCGEHL